MEQGAEINLKAGLAKMQAHVDYTNVMGYAKGFVKKHSAGGEKLEPVHIAIGAWVAMQKGELSNQTLIHHLQQHQQEIMLFAQIEGCPVVDISKLEDSILLGDIAKKVLEKLSESDDIFQTMVSVGLGNIANVANIEAIAFHEAGHAVVSLVLRPEIRLAKVSVIQSEGVGGFAQFEAYNLAQGAVTSREQVVDQLCVCLAGRIAQVVQSGLDAADGGAGNDIQKATQLAFAAVTELGLDEEYGPISLSMIANSLARLGAPFNQGYLFDEAQKRTQLLLKDAYRKTELLVKEHWADIESLAKTLVKDKEMTEAQVRAICCLKAE